MTACRSRTRFGKCGRGAGHRGIFHAVLVGADGTWFAWRSVSGRAVAVGYMPTREIEADQ